MGALALMVMLALGLAGCSTPEPTATRAMPTDTPDSALPSAVVAAGKVLSELLGISLDEVDYVSYERTEWKSSCLGAAKPGEMCAQVITPGWRVVLRAKGEEYVFHTDRSGLHVRQKE